MSESEYDDIPLEEQNKLYYITRSINGIVVVFFYSFYMFFSVSNKNLHFKTLSFFKLLLLDLFILLMHCFQ